jgi:primary-amine oxidase
MEGEMMIYRASMAALTLVALAMAPQHGHAATPWDALASEEITAAAVAVKNVYGDDVLFTEITLERPDKSAALAWRPGDAVPRAASVTFIDEGTAHEGVVGLQTGTVRASPIAVGQPLLSIDGELDPLMKNAPKDPKMAAALKARGIAPETVLCGPRTVGAFGRGAPETRRLAKVDCFVIDGAKRNAFARPVEGVIGLYDFNKRAFVEVVDIYEGRTPPPVPADTGDFDEETVPPRERLNAIRQTQTRGGNITRDGGMVAWQSWRFHLRFDGRQGTILSNVQYQDKERLRSVVYELAMSEMFVPYQDPTEGWYYRNYFDMGEYGFGNSSTALRGADCPDYADFMGVVLHNSAGMPVAHERRICLFEQNPALPVWRHTNPILAEIHGDTHESRPAVELVVRMVSTIGNYDYFQDYIFTLDGRIVVRLTATGIDAVKAVAAQTATGPTAAEDTAYGNLIAPGLAGINHDHFFSYRVDLDVDGHANSFERHKLTAQAAPRNSLRRSLWVVTPERVAAERAARTRINPDRPAILLVTNAAKPNALGYPAGYQIVPPMVTHPLVDPADPANARGAFTQYDLWVTPYARDELFASGRHINQAPAGLGLPRWTAANRSLENTDIVTWVTMGFHHAPVAEDWPVLPSKSDSFTLKPWNFFDRSPAIDVPAKMRGSVLR